MVFLAYDAAIVWFQDGNEFAFFTPAFDHWERKHGELYWHGKAVTLQVHTNPVRFECVDIF
jgi:hypothetical protein